MHTHIGRTSFVLASVVGLGAVVGLLASTTPGCKAFDADPVPDADASADAAGDAKSDAVVGPTCPGPGEACGSCCEGLNCIAKKCCAPAGVKATSADQCCDGPTFFHNGGVCLGTACTVEGGDCPDNGACCPGTTCTNDQFAPTPGNRCVAGACKVEGAPCDGATPCCVALKCDGAKCVKQ